jgi:murein L,D-transpeptidase YafK
VRKTIVILTLITVVAGGMALYLAGRSGQSPLSGAPDLKGKGRTYPVSGSSGLIPGSADLVFIEKKARSLTLFRGGKPLRSYRVALGFAPVGRKTAEGDGKTPEGRYTIDRRKGDSRYHRALHISYPNADDKRRAAALGVPAGGDIMIHGLMNGMGWIGRAHRMKDWTLGCVAVTNEEIEEIWRLVPDGVAVEIVP